MASQRLIDAVWKKGKKVRGANPDVYRRDSKGNIIRYASYGKTTDLGWQIDHIYPQSKGGSEHILNLQPLQTEANRIKGDKIPKNAVKNPERKKAPKKKK